jgi:hypothetical protein
MERQYGPCSTLVNHGLPPGKAGNARGARRPTPCVCNFHQVYFAKGTNKDIHVEAGRCMAYKLDGAKFATIEELIEALYPLYADKMSEEEFKKFVEENAEKS